MLYKDAIYIRVWHTFHMSFFVDPSTPWIKGGCNKSSKVWRVDV